MYAGFGLFRGGYGGSCYNCGGSCVVVKCVLPGVSGFRFCLGGLCMLVFVCDSLVGVVLCCCVGCIVLCLLCWLVVGLDLVGGRYVGAFCLGLVVYSFVWCRVLRLCCYLR